VTVTVVVALRTWATVMEASPVDTATPGVGSNVAPPHAETAMRTATSYNINDLTSTVNSYASPSIELALESLEVEGRKFVAISLQELFDYPIMCSRNLEVNNRAVVVKGRPYCRSRRMPESTEVQSPEDLREIVELAIAKGIDMAGKMRTQAPHPHTPRRDHVNGSYSALQARKKQTRNGSGLPSHAVFHS
jgi:hypothetical protein